MSFRYIIVTLNRNGLKETSVQELEKDEVLIGRGASSDIHLLGALVSLKHARLFIRDQLLFIEDLNSLGGVVVNNRLIKHRELRKGDTVKIGNSVFNVIKEESSWGLLERRTTGQDQDIAEFLLEQERKLRFQTYLPRISVVSGFVFLLFAIVFGVIPFSRKNPQFSSSGPISNYHQIIAGDCKACHAQPFVAVQDAQCLSCHTMSAHAQSLPVVFKKHTELDYRCGICHPEHRGDHYGGGKGPTIEESKLCVTCHSMLRNLVPAAQAKDITSFANHPEFRVALGAFSLGDLQWRRDVPVRVRLSERALLKDPAAIKLNHKVHLQENIRGEKGPVTLACSNCHHFNEDLKTISPIQFERDCQACHSLEFDSRFPGISVPHGNPNVVFNFLFAEYAKLFLATEGQKELDSGPQQLRHRQKPGETIARASAPKFSRSAIDDQSRLIEETLFTQTTCFLCHQITKKDSSEKVSFPAVSSYTVKMPNIPEQWMPEARFDHGAHQEVSCESCHTGVRTSSETSDVLLPGIETCRHCHGDEAARTGVRSNCIMCHSYHDSGVLEDSKKLKLTR